MPSLFGIRIDKLIQDNVGPLLTGKLYQDVAGVRDANDPTAGPKGGSVNISSFEGIVQFYRDNEVDNELILHQDRKILIKALSISPSMVPETGMRITMDDNPSDVYQVVRVNRDPATATYLCQGRL